MLSFLMEQYFNTLPSGHV